MGYILLILFFLIWRNLVHINKTLNKIAYGDSVPVGLFKRVFRAIADIRQENVEQKKNKKVRSNEQNEQKEVDNENVD